MPLPTFIGIGVQRGGTTWLHTLLGSHPSVYMPTLRKEIRFFDLYYTQGLGWLKLFSVPQRMRIDIKRLARSHPNIMSVRRVQSGFSLRCPTVS